MSLHFYNLFYYLVLFLLSSLLSLLSSVSRRLYIYIHIFRLEARFVVALSVFNTCIDWVFGKVGDQSRCKASFGDIKVTYHVFAHNAVIFAESLDFLVMTMAPEVLHEEVVSLALKVWTETKAQFFGGLLDDSVQSVNTCDEGTEVTENLHTLVG